MSRAVQVLEIDPPHELVFKGPFNDVLTCLMRLRNPTERQVCFKCCKKAPKQLFMMKEANLFIHEVKTTAPKQYCVRPNSSILSPGETCNVAVMLQPLDASSSVEMEHAKHKFMVQSIYAPPGDLSLDDIWKKAQPSDLMDSKLRVVFEHPPAAEYGGDKTPPRVPAESKSTTGGHAANMDAEVRKVMEEKNRVEAAKAILERDNNSLKARLAALEAIPQVRGNQISEGGITILQTVLIAFSALMFGLIFGKLF